MNNITIFNNELFGAVRTLIIDDKPYFVGKDIAEALGYKEPHKAISRHCKHGMKHPIVDITGFEQSMNIIPEGDVYRLIFKSKLPAAEQFEEWIMDEVIPQLRNTGVVILEHATEEDVSFEFLYGKDRLKKTFEEAVDPIAEYERFKKLSKVKRDGNHHAYNNESRETLIKEMQNL
jgi:prophage antirepressor-like protein